MRTVSAVQMVATSAWLSAFAASGDNGERWCAISGNQRAGAREWRTRLVLCAHQVQRHPA